MARKIKENKMRLYTLRESTKSLPRISKNKEPNGKSDKITGLGMLAGIAAALLVACMGLSLFVAGARSAEPAKVEPIDCILVAGQSNAVGYDADPDKLPADDADQKILFWWRCGDPPPDEHDSTCDGKWTHCNFSRWGIR